MTGFSEERAAPHDAQLERLIARLAERGYQPERNDVGGDAPDLVIRDRDGRKAFVDLKTAYAHNKNYAIKLGALREFSRLSLTTGAVYIAWGDGFVDTPETVLARIQSGPQRPTGSGSDTDWVRVGKGGTPFNDFFTRKPSFQWDVFEGGRA